MRVGATGNDVETAFAEGRRKDLGIVDDGAGIDLVFRRQRLAEGHGLGGDDVHQRPALETRKKSRIDLLAEVQVVRQHHAARSEERRVGKEGVSTVRSRWARYH